MRRRKTGWKILFLLILVAAALTGYFLYACKDNDCALAGWQKVKVANSFDECVAAGFPVTQSYPRQCKSGDQTFTETIQPNITASSPQPNQEIGLPLVIDGQARVFESTFSYRLRDQNGDILTEGTAMANAPDAGQFGPFHIEASYPEPKGITGTIEVFDYSAKDGSEQDKVTIPVRFGKVDTMTVKVFFGNNAFDPGTFNCGTVYATSRRIAKTNAPAGQALQELLQGPDANETNQGFFTTINPGAHIQSLAIENGVAKADFDQMLQQGVAGSCKVAAIRGQITETLKQFPTVQRVVISINGKSDEILQP